MSLELKGSGIIDGAKSILEDVTITASAPTATTNFDYVTQSIQYYTSNASTNFTLNIRGNNATTFNSLLAAGQALTMVLMVTNGATPFRPTAFQIDGSAITPEWQGGVAPAAGNANSIDVYSFTVIKTAATPTYVVLASQTQFT